MRLSQAESFLRQPAPCLLYIFFKFVRDDFRLAAAGRLRYTVNMRSRSLLWLAVALPAMAELPPSIPAGDVQYSDYSYEPALTPAYAGGLSETPDTGFTDASYTGGYTAPESAPSSEQRGYVNLNAYTTNYQVRGMGVTNDLSHYGYSSLSGSYTFPNRNLFGRGIQQRVGGEFGAIWGADDPLGDTPFVRFDYAVGKEIFPNLLAEIGYSLHHGGLEGLVAHGRGYCPHRLAQDVNAKISFNDRQHGIFAHALAGAGFQGLTGYFFDAEAGYRFTGVLNLGNFGADVEISAGIAPSVSYWATGAEGVDAYRIKVALPVFTHNGTLGHDAHPYLRPWMSWAWSGCNARKIDRAWGGSPVDHFQFTLGVDCGWNF